MTKNEENKENWYLDFESIYQFLIVINNSLFLPSIPRINQIKKSPKA